MMKWSLTFWDWRSKDIQCQKILIFLNSLRYYKLSNAFLRTFSFLEIFKKNNIEKLALGKNWQIRSICYSIFSASSPSTWKYGPEKTPYLDILYTVWKYNACSHVTLMDFRFLRFSLKIWVKFYIFAQSSCKQILASLFLTKFTPLYLLLYGNLQIE